MRICLVKEANNRTDAALRCQMEVGFDPEASFCVGNGMFLCTDKEGVEWKRKNLK